MKDDSNNVPFYLLRPCKGAVGFVSTLKKKISLDLSDCIQKLENFGFKVVDADVMLIAEKEIELTIYKSGKILARTEDKDIAKVAIDEAYKVILTIN